jgi:glycosyltransferase involved in cell wall biosynthesis
MLDLAAFLALTRPQFEHVPVLAYFHENQMTYPRLRGTKFNSWFGQINYMTALAADAVAFNSEFHRSDFLGALKSLLSQPNNWLLAEGVDEVERKSFVLPVGVELGWIDALEWERETSGPRTILWNHRWEFDKSPELFVRALDAVAARGIEFQLIIAGEPGDNPSDAIASLPERFPGRIRHFGFAPSKEDYGRLLWQSDIAVSTTRHEFFGIGMVEAMAAGCIPCAPKRYNYPALVPPQSHEALLWENEADLIDKLGRLLTAELPDREPVRESARRFAWANVIGEWDRVLSALRRGDFATKPSIPDA